MNNALITPPIKNIFALLDIGSTRILCLIIKIISNNEIVVLGEGYTQSNGIRCGAIMHVKEARECIIGAIQEAEKGAQHTVDQVYINISGCGATSQSINTSTLGGNREMTAKDISRIIQQATKEVPKSHIPVHAIPLKYQLDQIEGIHNPMNMHGSDLYAQVHVISALRSALLNVEHCLNQCLLNLRGCSISSYASGLACLTADERKVGSIMIDIGGGSTAIGIFKNNHIIHADYIPIGGIHITYDIACAFNLRLSTAERIKNLYGSSIITSSEMTDFVDIEDEPNNRSAKKIAFTTLSHVIRPRLEEIFELIHSKVTAFALNNVVISGGTSQMPNIRELAELVMSTETRIGSIHVPEGLSSQTLNGSYAGIIGLAGIITQSKTLNPSNKGYYDKMRKLFSVFNKKTPFPKKQTEKMPNSCKN